MSILPTVVRAEYAGDFRIHLAFNDSCEATLDFRRWLNGPIFDAVRDANYFPRFFLDGGTVTWPNGADIAPETLHRAAKDAQRG